MSDTITKQHVISDLKRELGMRRHLYPKWIREGRIDEWKAKHQIACIEKAIEMIDPPAPSLFDGAPR